MQQFTMKANSNTAASLSFSSLLNISHPLEIHEEKDHAWVEIDGTYIYGKDAQSLLNLLKDMKKNTLEGERSLRS